MPNVLAVAAFEIGNPLTILILVKADDLSHGQAVLKLRNR
jgi:hypothetical protein